MEKGKGGNKGERAINEGKQKWLSCLVSSDSQHSPTLSSYCRRCTRGFPHPPICPHNSIKFCFLLTIIISLISNRSYRSCSGVDAGVEFHKLITLLTTVINHPQRCRCRGPTFSPLPVGVFYKLCPCTIMYL